MENSWKRVPFFDGARGSAITRRTVLAAGDVSITSRTDLCSRARLRVVPRAVGDESATIFAKLG